MESGISKERQMLSGLELSPAQRLSWLYRMIQFFQRFGGAANKERFRK